MSFVQTVVNDFRRTFASRQELQAEDSISSLAVNESRGFRLPIVYGNDDVVLSDKGSWTGFQIPPKPHGFLDQSTQESYGTNATQFFTSLFPAEKENQGHILVTNRVYSPTDWERELVGRQGNMALPSFAPYIRATREAIDAAEFFERDTYCFVRLGDRGHHQGVTGALRKGMEYLMLGFGMEETQPSPEEIEEWGERAATVTDTLSGSWLQAQPINRSRVEWLVRHLDSPGLPTPASIESADGEAWGIGWWRTVLASYTRPVDLGRTGMSRYKGIEFDSPAGEGRTYAAFLPLSYIPTRVHGSLSNWMHHASRLDFPVDASLRFEIIDPDRAQRMIQRPINAAEAQAEEDREAGVATDDTTQHQQAELRGLKTGVKLGRKPLARWQAVFCVYDTDKDALRSKITRLIKHYKDVHMELVNPRLDQRELFYQSFPGGEIEVEDWIHRTDANYLAAAQPWLTSTVGDSVNPGLYQGFTVVEDANGRPQKGVPVFADLLNVVDTSGTAPTEAVAAESGSGKTVSRGVKCVYEDAMRGITQFVWDPKGDFLSLYRHARRLRLDPSRIKVIDLYNSEASVSLDAFGIAELDLTNPSLPRDEREASAMEVLAALALRGITSDLRMYADSLLRTAVRRELAKEDHLTGAEKMSRRTLRDRPLEEEPCMQGVIATLRAWKEDPSTIPIDGVENPAFLCNYMAEGLEGHARTALGKLLMRRPSESGALSITEGDLTIFVAINLETTDKETTQEDKNVVPDLIAGMMADYIRAMMYRLPDHYIKAATFDEWHVISRSSRADALVRWLRRMGRSKRCMVRQMSQSASDFSKAGDQEGARTSLTTIWCGKVLSTGEAKASCDLLGIESSPGNMGTLMNLGKGQFLFRDVAGRIGFVQVDFIDQEILRLFDTDAARKQEVLASLSMS